MGSRVTEGRAGERAARFSPCDLSGRSARVSWREQSREEEKGDVPPSELTVPVGELSQERRTCFQLAAVLCVLSLCMEAGQCLSRSPARSPLSGRGAVPLNPKYCRGSISSSEVSSLDPLCPHRTQMSTDTPRNPYSSSARESGGDGRGWNKP